MSKEDLENLETLLEAEVRQNNGDVICQRRQGGTFNLHGLLTKVRKELESLARKPATV